MEVAPSIPHLFMTVRELLSELHKIPHEYLDHEVLTEDIYNGYEVFNNAIYLIDKSSLGKRVVVPVKNEKFIVDIIQQLIDEEQISPG